MVTPFDASGAVDLDRAVELARHLASHGSDSLVVSGTTGESPVLSDEEKVDLWRAVAAAVTVPVIAGSTTSDTAHSIELTAAAGAAGAAAVLAVTPYYSRPSQEGIARHFSAIAESTPLPVLLYDVPVRTGRKLQTATALRLAAAHPNIVGVKDASGDPVSTARLVAGAPDGFEVYSGDDSLTLPLLAIGVVGVVSVAAHWVGEEIAEMIARFLDGDVEGARRLNADLIEAVAFQASEDAPSPMPTKAVLRQLGIDVGQCRLPHGAADGALDEAAAALLAALGAWRSSRLAEAAHR